MNAIKNQNRYTALNFLVLLFFSSTLTGCPATTMSTGDFRQIEGLLSQSPGGANDFIIVDCLLPGQIKQLGTGMIYISRGPSKQLPAGECALQGGQFALPGQTRYDKAVTVWMPQARAGDKTAQYYVGEIYQRGTGGSPQYELAAQWYRKAAEQGLTRAQMNLAYLYSKGLGVEKNPQEAQRWYRQATGLGDTVSLDENAISIEEREELKRLRAEVNRGRRDSQLLKQQLEQSQEELKKNNRRLEQLKKEPESQTQRQGVNQLIANIEQDQKKIESLIKQLAHYQNLFDGLPPPRIDVSDDSPPTTRGIRYDAGLPDTKKRIVVGTVYAPAGLASFKLNQQTLEVQPNGKFRASVSLNQTGETKVVLVAVDRRNISTTVTHTLFSVAGSDTVDLGKYKTIIYGRYHALIVGNVDYQILPDLKTAVKDARAVDAILRDKYGFDTTLLIDVSRFEIMESLNRFEKILTKNDNLLIYYAGHGIMDTEHNWGYWQPVDADEDSTSNWIANEDVTRLLSKMKAKHVLLVSDSCYAGTLLRGVAEHQETPTAPDARVQYIKQMVNGRARKVLASGELEPVLDIGSGGHSVFANVLLDVLKSNDRVMEGALLYQAMKARVVRDSKLHGLTQVPQYSGNSQAGDGPGDFIFVPKKFQ